MSHYLVDKIKDNLVKGIRNSPETMEFLTAQAREVFNDCKTLWIGQQSKEEAADRELWCEYHNEAHKKIEKYIANWIYDLAEHSYITADKLPSGILSSFESIILSAMEYVDRDIGYEITEYIMEIFYNEEEEGHATINLQGDNIP